MTQVHDLKTIDHYFDAVACGKKTFEVRKNDRAFQTGDLVKLIKVDERGNHIPDPNRPGGDIAIVRQITYILQGGQFGVAPAHCILALSPDDASHLIDEDLEG